MGDLETMNRHILRLGRGRTSMVDAACDVTGYLYDNLLDDDGERACVMVRLYVTQPVHALSSDLQDIARSLAPDVTDASACLTTLAHNGSPELPPESLPEEYVLPFTDELMASIPFLPNLLEQVGVDLDSAIDPRRAIDVRLQHRTLNVYSAHRPRRGRSAAPEPAPSRRGAPTRHQEPRRSRRCASDRGDAHADSPGAHRGAGARGVLPSASRCSGESRAGAPRTLDLRRARRCLLARRRASRRPGGRPAPSVGRVA